MNKILSVIKRFTGVHLEATRDFLLRNCFIPGKGFSSQYAGQGTVSCATSAIYMYALSETGHLTQARKREFARILLAFRASLSDENAGAFPRTTGGQPNTRTTGQAVLALLTVGAPWDRIRPSVQWLIARQAKNGGWNYPGTGEGHERLIYTLYPSLVLFRCQAQLGKTGKDALSRVSAFVESCEEQQNPFWAPLRNQLRRLVGRSRRQKSAGDAALDEYWRLFEDRWPTERVDEDWLPERFNMALMCGTNYLLLRPGVAADHPLALLHVRYLADERLGNGWSDQHEEHPKTWATALGALTLHRWARDFCRLRPSLTRLPTRSELVLRLRSETGREGPRSKEARSLVRRFSQLEPGARNAAQYQLLVLDAFVFLFGDVLKDPKSESSTFLGTLRRDVTFKNFAETGPWLDWKNEHHILLVLIECKNKEKLSYDDLRQTACYIGRKMGRLGILACRKTTPDDVREMLNWFVNNDDKYVLVVNDDSLIDWIKLKDRGENPTSAIADVYRSLRESSQ
jgi:hypothetical protein